MLLLFWRRVPDTEGAVTVQAGGTAVMVAARGGAAAGALQAGSGLVVQGVAGHRATVALQAQGALTAIGFYTRGAVAIEARVGLTALAVHGGLAALEVGAQAHLAAPEGVHGGLAASELGAAGLLAVPGWIPARTGAQELATTAWLTSSGRRAATSLPLRLQAVAILAVEGGIAGHHGHGMVRAVLAGEVVGIRRLMPRIPMQQLVPIDLGTGYRGDTMILPVWAAVTREGEPYDLEGATLYFTAKEDLLLPDVAPRVIQCSTEDGGITVLEPPEQGYYRVRIHAWETQELLGDTVFTFDVQMTGDGANIYTIRRGLLTVVRDVTRATS